MITIRRLRFTPLYPVLGLLGACAQAFSDVATCDSPIYCTGELLHRVQLARIFPDSKTFVDLKMIHSPNDTLDDFAMLMQETNHNPTRLQLLNFVNDHFLNEQELEVWTPPDFNPEPPILKQISDPNLRQFAKDVISIWPTLGRKIVPDVAKYPERHSIINLPNGFIIPGGRFREIYYWDSYWIVRGLLISNMTETAKLMIDNLLHLVKEYEYVPNGSRLYYLGRSQPPLLTAMVASYVNATGDVGWLEQNIDTVEKELQYWLEKKIKTIKVNGKKYMLLRYLADSKLKGPRPESYYADYTNAQNLPNEDTRENFYAELKSSAESGWDFSTRWFPNFNTKDRITSIRMSHVIPVDLNAIFAGALELAGDLRKRLKDRRKAHKWYSVAKYWRNAIENVLWNNQDGVWYDFDTEKMEHRRAFYISCITPLWTGAVETYEAPKYAARLVRYLLSTAGLEFPGGVPTSLVYSGEQWDFPNVWPPVQSMLISCLEMSGYDEAKVLAKEQARLWIHSNLIGYNRTRKMFEKYSAVEPGKMGGGGEYFVQDGFGWTNGVVLELLQKYGKELTFDIPAKETRRSEVPLDN